MNLAFSSPLRLHMRLFTIEGSGEALAIKDRRREGFRERHEAPPR